MFLKNYNKVFAAHVHNYVPKHSPVDEVEVGLLRRFVDDSNKILILTGAGISTESGIPDYRSEEVGLYARTNHKPVQYIEFLRSARVRQRYWARNYIGWEGFSRCEPNSTHYWIKNLETIKNVSAVVTQNVDGLHLKCGSTNVIELHGTAFKVVCLRCREVYDRFKVQEWLKKLNPSMNAATTTIRPDGDVELSHDKVATFKPPFCEACGGILKPDMVFFGDNVPKERVIAVRNLVSSSDSIIVLGSSLSVYSGYRYVVQAVEEQKPVAIVNIGATRADKIADLKISAECGDVLLKI